MFFAVLPAATAIYKSLPRADEVKQVYYLPSVEEAEERLSEVFEDKRQMYILEEEVLRKPYNMDGEELDVFINFETSDKQKEAIDDCVDEFNDIFKIINPNYAFKLHFRAPNEAEKSDKLSTIINKAAMDYAYGKAYVYFQDYYKGIDGREVYVNIINIEEKVTTSKREELFYNVFKHEFAHSLGLDDAYTNEHAPTNTIMQSSDLSRTSLRYYDVATLDALYRAPNNPIPDTLIENFIISYDDEHSTDVAEKLYSKSVANIDITKLTLEIANSDIPDEDKKALFKHLENGIDYEKDFGKKDCNFYEIKNEYDLDGRYAYTQIKTEHVTDLSPGECYYKWTNLSKTGTGTEERSMKTLDGILIGNENVFFKVGDYILNFFCFQSDKIIEVESLQIFKETEKDMSSIRSQIFFKDAELQS